MSKIPHMVRRSLDALLLKYQGAHKANWESFWSCIDSVLIKNNLMDFDAYGELFLTKEGRELAHIINHFVSKYPQNGLELINSFIGLLGICKDLKLIVTNHKGNYKLSKKGKNIIVTLEKLSQLTWKEAKTEHKERKWANAHRK